MQFHIDDPIASLLGVSGQAISYETLLEAVSEDDRAHFRSVIVSFPTPAVSELRFTFFLAEKGYEAQVFFDEETTSPASEEVKGYLQLSPLEGVRDLPGGTTGRGVDAVPAGKPSKGDTALLSADFEKFRTLTEHWQTGYCQWDLLQRQGCADSRWYENVGELPQRDLGEVFDRWEGIHPEDRGRLLEALSAMRTGERTSAQFEVRFRADDAWRWSHLSLDVTHFQPESESVVVVVVNIDITRYKALQAELAEALSQAENSLKHYSKVLDSLSSALIYIDADYMIQWSSFHALKGVRPSSKYITGERCYRSVFGRSEPCESCSFREMLKTGERKTSQFKEEEWGTVFEITANPIREDDGRVAGGIIQMTDVTIKCEQERKIRELNYVMDAILNNTPVYIFVKNPNDGFRYIYWNKAMAEHTKVPVEKVLGQTDFEVFPRLVDAEKFRKDDLELLRTRENLEFQEEYFDAVGGKRVVHTLKTIIPSEEELPWLLGVSWDITELKNTESELIKAKERAEESDKFKSMFLANMSHEIRTPLNAIVGFAELLMDETLSEEDKKEYLTIMKNNTQLLLQLVSDILDLSRIESQDLELDYDQMNLHSLCSQIAMTSCMQPSCRVPVEFDTTLPKYLIYGDEKRVQQIITNLVNNAIKFTDEGEIRITYRLLEGDEIEISVTDTGSGIPEDKIGSIFDRFVKLNSFAQGTGLGLSICKNLVERMQGRMGVESQVGVGSRFWFVLPCKSDHL